jgi:hypothetical protein
MSFSAFAQAPNLLNYQGVARNNVGNPLPNQTMKLRLSIHDLLPSGAVVYSEIRAITTNLGGLFSVQIGSAGASSSTGTLGGVNWVVGNKFLQVELDPASNNNYIDIGTVQLVSVPYAFGAGSAATVKTNANLTGVVTSVGNATSIANGAITSDMIGTLNKSKVGLDLVNNTSDAAKPISELTQVALGTKLNISDSANGYITPTQLASYNFSRGNSAVTIDTTNLSNRINLKSNAVDVNNLATVVAANTASITAETIRATAAEVILTSKIASNTASITANTAAINIKASANDLATLTTNVTSNTGSITSNTTDIAILKTNIASNTASISSNTAALVLKANIASPIFTGIVTTGVINTGSLSSTSITASTYASVPKTLSYTGTTINWDPAQGLNAAITLSQNSTLSFTAAPPVGTYGTIVLTQDGTGSRTINLPTIASVTNKVLGSTSTSTVTLSTAANSKDILNFYFDGTHCYWNIGQGYGTAASASNSGNTNLASAVTGILAVANGGTGAANLTGYVKGAGTSVLTANASIPVADVTGAAPLASPTFTGTVTAGEINSGALSATSVNTGIITATSINSPIYASTPQALTDGSAITWNPALGLNASVTLAGNRTLSFTSTPIAGAYGTLVVSQDGTGNRTLTLPSTANKVLGSISTTTIALSTAASAKDILNFYYDGTNCFWNIGQGYGASQIPVSAATLTTARTIHGGSFDGSTNVTNIIASTYGGTGNAYTKFLGPSTTERTFTLPDANATILTNNAVVTLAQGGTGATTLTGLLKGNGTNALTAAVSGTDYQAPIILTTTGTGAATLSGTSLNIPTPSSSSGTAHTVGESYGGGIIFYITTGGFHGLIADTYENGNASNEEALDFVTNPNYHNSTYSGNLYTDWRVPTYYELTLLYNARTTNNLNLTTGTYISCTYTAYSTYKNLKFSDKSIQYENANWVPRTLRAIRSF